MNDVDAIKNYLNSWAQAAQRTSSDTAELCTRSLTKLIQSLEWELNTAKQEVEGLRRVIANSITKEAAVEQINAAYEPMVTELAAERKEGDTLRETVQTLRNLQEADRAEIEQLKNDLKLTRDEVNTANAEAQQWARNCKASDLEVITLKQRLHNVEQDHAQISDHCTKVIRELEIAQLLYRRVRGKLKNCTRTIQAQGEELAVVRTGLEVCTAVLETVEQKYEALRSETGKEVLAVAFNMTSGAVNALQFGNHHGHQQLWKAICAFRREAHQ